MREKLIELLICADDYCNDNCNKGCNVCKYNGNVDCYYNVQADHLIANGVTFQTRDIHWATEQAYKNGKEAGKPKWISVNDRLPTEEAEEFEREWGETPDFLVMIEGAYLPTKLYYDWENDEWFKINTALKREKYKVTHWMPLPEPPKGE